ncbi:hypothetical protein B7R21_11635 [Subtercola boreus]|uniref:Uncharacterized protein n=1 Tax=Subtercola boreus TaxID=120213 RepID=A0A3E0VR93_9MICO|nr:hypothetical protein B7R21_11635 [Subtercola boreus]
METYAPANCDYVRFTASQFANATPLDNYRGTYESIAANMQTVAVLCGSDPADADAVNLAVLTRRDVVKVMNAQKVLGNAAWGNPEPVPGKQAG